MCLYQKIYFNNKPLVLTNSASKYLMHHEEAAGYLFLKGAFVRNLRLARSHLKSLLGYGVILEDIDMNAFQPILDEFFTPVTAAGGVITTPKGKTLMIYRRGKWDLPKGKLDAGETIAECAVREVMEETGLPESIHAGKEIDRSFHVYLMGNKEVLKTTHWFQMSVDKEWPLVPQKEENISEAKWISEEELSACAQKSWNAVKEVLEKAGKLH